MLYDPQSRFLLAQGQQREALREAAQDGRAKEARRSQVRLLAVLLLNASRALFALGQRLKSLAEDQAMRA
jgi:hypothetical protein